MFNCRKQIALKCVKRKSSNTNHGNYSDLLTSEVPLYYIVENYFVYFNSSIKLKFKGAKELFVDQMD